VAPRTILYTGKGGVGKTSVAAASARALAASGRSTLVISTGPAHSLAESLGTELGNEPSPVADGLWGQQISAQEEMQSHWSAVQGWMGELLAERGVDRISAEELTVPPGMDELFSLLVLREHHASEAFDAIVVDCAPTGETLRLLAFPDVARWWIEKVFPFERQILAAARPLARTLLDIPLPDQAVFAEVQRLSEKLIAMNAILRDRAHCSIRLVMNPDRMVIGEAMRTFTYLGLYGYLCDAVVVNRLFGEGVGDYFAAWRRTQEEHMVLVREAFDPVPVLTAPYFEQEVLGGEMLDRLGHALFADADPGAVLFTGMSQELTVSGHGASLRLALPLADKGRISLKKIGTELVVGVDGQRRTISLPPAMAQMRAGAARFEAGELQIEFDG
jgi:arsenite/tail-anchored protein-transporting ATPase